MCDDGYSSTTAAPVAWSDEEACIVFSTLSEDQMRLFFAHMTKTPGFNNKGQLCNSLANFLLQEDAHPSTPLELGELQRNAYAARALVAMESAKDSLAAAADKALKTNTACTLELGLACPLACQMVEATRDPLGRPGQRAAEAHAMVQRTMKDWQHNRGTNDDAIDKAMKQALSNIRDVIVYQLPVRGSRAGVIYIFQSLFYLCNFRSAVLSALNAVTLRDYG
jgi:hypothetical protein